MSDVTTSYAGLRARAIESLLIEKGYLTEEAVDYVVSAYEHDIGPMRGAKLVARAWSDPGFKARLLENASEAAKELGVQGFVGENVMAVENTAEVHNVVCCTLCSCYPWAVLGLPPTWYKSPEYRSRIVREPRAVLADFGLDVPQGKEIRVWDSSSDMRYMVVPERPGGHRWAVGGAARRAGHARRDDRHRPAEGAVNVDVEGPAAPPRSNGELVFEEPWESRAFGVAVALSDRETFAWERFRQELIAEIGAWQGDDWSYYERWLAALEHVLLADGVLDKAEIEARMAEIEEHDHHDHDHDH